MRMGMAASRAFRRTCTLWRVHRRVPPTFECPSSFYSLHFTHSLVEVRAQFCTLSSPLRQRGTREMYIKGQNCVDKCIVITRKQAHLHGRATRAASLSHFCLHFSWKTVAFCSVVHNLGATFRKCQRMITRSICTQQKTIATLICLSWTVLCTAPRCRRKMFSTASLPTASPK